MPTFYDIPEHILHDILLSVIDSTKHISWMLSLRLVNHEFNEAMLHTFYLQRLSRAKIGHSPECIRISLPVCACKLSGDERLRTNYRQRFMFQSLLVNRNLLSVDTPYHQLVQQWKAAIVILHDLERLQQLGVDQYLLYSTRSSNPVFNNVPSAVLADALGFHFSFVFQSSLTHQVEDNPDNSFAGCEGNPTEFWVALCACVLDDLQLLARYSDGWTQPIQWPQLGISSSALKSDDPHLIALKVAIEHGSPRVVRHLLKIALEILPHRNPHRSELVPFLQAAIFGQNIDVLKAVLQYTPNDSQLLEWAMPAFPRRHFSLVEGSEIVRLLVRHFTPLVPRVRAKLICMSCATGNVVLLEEFSQTGPLFSSAPLYHGHGLSYLHYALVSGNHELVRSLLDEALIEGCRPFEYKVIKQSLMFNQIQCYREIHRHRKSSIADIALAEGMEDLLAECISEQSGAKELAPYALWNAIQRLRVSNIQFLLDAGTPLLPWDSNNRFQTGVRNKTNPLEIPWPYFEKNRDAYSRTQATLEAFGLPKLRIVV